MVDRATGRERRERRERRGRRGRRERRAERRERRVIPGLTRTSLKRWYQ